MLKKCMRFTKTRYTTGMMSEAISKKKKTVIEKIYKLGKLPGIDIVFTIC